MRSSGVLLLLIFLAVLGTACSPNAAYKAALKTNTVQGWREYLGDRPEPSLIEAARERLGDLEFDDARRLNTVLGYRRFLDEFPDHARAPEIELLLENLHFAAAAARDTAAAWDEFLLDHGHGAHADEARTRRAERELEGARRAGTAAALEGFAKRWPHHPAAAELATAGDAQAFVEAKAAGPEGLKAYLEAHPDGRSRDEARRLLRAREVEALIELEDLAAARGAARRIPGDDVQAALLARVDQAEVELAGLSLDPKILEELAAKLPAPAATAARAAAVELRRDPASLAKLRAAAVRLDPAKDGRPIAELLRGVVSASDAHDQRAAAVQLGHEGGAAAIDGLLSVVSDAPFLSVRIAAWEALHRIAAALPPVARSHEAGGRAELLRPIARDHVTLVRLAVLEELTGELRAAEEDWVRAGRERPDDPLVSLRVSLLRAGRGDAVAGAIAARNATLLVAHLADERWASSRSVGGAPLAGTARQLCGTLELLRRAGEPLAAVPAAGLRDFPDDLAAWRKEQGETVRRISERLAEAEAELRADRPFPRCSEDPSAARAAAAETDRLSAVAELSRLGDRRALPLLRRTALRDPAPAVRSAAAEVATALAAPQKKK